MATHSGDEPAREGLPAARAFFSREPLPAGLARRLPGIATGDPAAISSEDAIESGAWDALVTACHRHAILPQLAALAEAGHLGEIPATWTETLCRLRAESIASDRTLLVVLSDLLDAARARGIEVICLKGHAVAERVVADPAMRPSRDVDLLVRRADLDAAGEILLARGFAQEKPEAYAAHHFHQAWVHRSRSVAERIELHWDLTASSSPVRFDVDGWFRAARPFRLRAGPVLLAPPAEEIAYLAYHAAANGTFRLRELADVRGLLLGAPQEARGAVREAAERAGSGGFLRRATALVASYWPGPDAGTAAGTGSPSSRERIAGTLFDPERVLRCGSAVWWPLEDLGYWALCGERPWHELFTRPYRSARRGVAPDWEPAGRGGAARVALIVAASAPIALWFGARAAGRNPQPAGPGDGALRALASRSSGGSTGRGSATDRAEISTRR